MGATVGVVDQIFGDVDLCRGLPRISPSLLSARPRSREHAGVVKRATDAKNVSYRLTAAERIVFHPIGEVLTGWYRISRCISAS
ncbi:MAG: hypothetical protein LJE70_18085 [Chromatiaceae bacterium]|nr:hypothetical protein [Chromatiaceae bacterium]